MRVTTNRTKKTTNKIHAIWVAAPAIPLSPRTPAIIPMIRKVMLQLSISSFSFFRDGTANSDSSLFVYSCLRQLTQLAPYNARNREESTAARIGLARKAEQTFRKDFDCANELRFPNNFLGIFIFPQPDKLRMPQVTVWRPLCKLYLRDQLRFKPHTVFHLFLGQSPLGLFSLRQIRKRAHVDL